MGINIDVDGSALNIRCYKVLVTDLLEVCGKIVLKFYIEEAEKIGMITTYAQNAYVTYPKMHTKFGIEVANVMVMHTDKFFKDHYAQMNEMVKKNPPLKSTPFHQFYSRLHATLTRISPDLPIADDSPGSITHHDEKAHIHFPIPEELHGRCYENILVTVTDVDDPFNDSNLKKSENQSFLDSNYQAYPEEYACYNEILRATMKIDIFCDGIYTDLKKELMMNSFLRFLKGHHAMHSLDIAGKPWKDRKQISVKLLFFYKKTVEQLCPKELLETIKNPVTISDIVTQSIYKWRKNLRLNSDIGITIHEKSMPKILGKNPRRRR